MTESPVIVAENIAYRYPGRRRDALCGAILSVTGTQWVGLLGPNGGGKTTLLRLLLGQLVPNTAGRIEVFGKPPARVRRRIGYVPQHAHIDSSVPASVLDIVLLGRLTSSSWGPFFDRRDRELAAEALDETRCGELADLRVERAVRRSAAAGAHRARPRRRGRLCYCSTSRQPVSTSTARRSSCGCSNSSTIGCPLSW
jgi:ABC-type Mn2+/Zn2+ transport system ATPase subunit